MQTHLLERDFTCPGCGKRIPSLDKLEKDADTRRKVKEYIEKTIEDGKNQGEEGGKSEVDVTNSGPTVRSNQRKLDISC